MKCEFIGVSVTGLLLVAGSLSFSQQPLPQVEKVKPNATKPAEPMVAIAGAVYKSADGRYVVESEAGGNPLYSKDGVRFFELYQLPSEEYNHRSFDDGGRERKYWYRHDLIVFGGEQVGRRIFAGVEADGPTVVLKGENFVLAESVLKRLDFMPLDIMHNAEVRTFGWNLVYGGQLFTRINEPIQGVVVPLKAQVRHPDKLYHLIDGSLLYLRAKNDGAFKLYQGKADALMRDLSINKVVRHGGATYIYTEEGTLCAPDETAAYQPSWSLANSDKKERAVRLYGYDISESPEGIRLSPSADQPNLP